MLKLILIIVTGSLLFSCSNAHNKTSDKVSEKDTIVTGQPFFEYDQIDYYSTTDGSEKLMALNKKSNQSTLETLELSVLNGLIPFNIDDTGFIRFLPTFNFTQKTVAPEKFSQINEIFIEKEIDEMIATACSYIFSDILIFRNRSKIIGMAKICFGCMGNRIIGSQANTVAFGQLGDYEKLEKILKE